MGRLRGWKRLGKAWRVRICQMVCVMGGLALYLGLSWSDRRQQELTQGRYLERPAHGSGEAVYRLLVEGLEDGEVSAEVAVGERQYTQEQAEEVFERLLDGLPEQVRRGNPSLREVREDLDLPTWMEVEGVRLAWSSTDPEILDSYGRVHNQELPEDGRQVCLQVQMNDGAHKAVYELEVQVLPRYQSEEEERLSGFLEEVEQANMAAPQEPGIWLPEEYDGKKLYYRISTGAHYEILLVLGVLLAFLCHAKEQMEEQDAGRRRARQLLLDYSEVVSKLMVLIGAGMTIRLAWEKMAADYEAARREGTWPARPAYEEICRASGQMQKGMSEGQAYKEFGNRCAQPCYLKLSSLLEQNRRTGTKNLRQLLEREMQDAFEQRKNLARKMGEEASTKLLLPLFLMLGIVMVMIVVPAFLAF